GRLAGAGTGLAGPSGRQRQSRAVHRRRHPHLRGAADRHPERPGSHHAALRSRRCLGRQRCSSSRSALAQRPHPGLAQPRDPARGLPGRLLPQRHHPQQSLGPALRRSQGQGQHPDRSPRRRPGMSKPTQQMSIGMNILGFGAHSAAWRVGEVPANSLTDLDYFVNIARISERGTLDAIFLADGPALAGDVSRQPSGRLEPTILLTAIALATKHIGVIATASPTSNEPFNLARRIASLDHVSGGRAAWNLVTTYNDAAAQNFGQQASALHAERYGRGEEFAEVMQRLWDSWEDDALIGDAERGLYADPAKVHTIDFAGRYLSVRGPLNVPRSPQGRPVVVQAGSSEDGKRVGARYADAIFTTQTTLADGQAFYTEMKNRARA